MSVPQEIERRCWGCGYSLTGLAAGSPCPECGRIAPTPVHACRAHGTGGPAVPIVGCVAIVLIVAGVAVRATERPRLGNSDFVLWGVVVALIAAGVITKWRRHRRDRLRRARLIVVSTEGVAIFDANGTASRVAASLISGVTVTRSPLSDLHGVRTALGDGRSLHQVVGFLPPSEAEPLAEAIRSIIEP